MTVATGTATDHTDLFNKLKTFLTSGIGGGQNWVQAWAASGGDPYPTDVVMRGPGLSGTDEIFVGMRLHEDFVGDSYWIEFHGMTGVIPLATDVQSHVNNCPNPSHIFLDGGPMDYWFIGNGRRFIVVVKISTVFESAYCGFILPFGTPSEYPYPMLIGGTSGTPTTYSESPESWRDNVIGHSAFPWPYANTSFSRVTPNVHIFNPQGDWMTIANTGTTEDGTIGPGYTKGSYFSTADTYALYAQKVYERMIDCYGGDNMLVPITVFLTTTNNQTLGVLDGCYKCQGAGQSAEDLITPPGGNNHLVVPNVYRTEFWDYFAVELN